MNKNEKTRGRIYQAPCQISARFLLSCPAAAIALIMTLSIPGTAHSQEQEYANPVDLTQLPIEQLMNIEVYTASKFPQKTTEAPANVTIITAADIKRYGYRTLANVLNSVRGMYVTNDSNSYLTVRGSGGTRDFNGRILLLVDGYRPNGPVYDTAAIGTEFPVDIDLIERSGNQVARRHAGQEHHSQCQRQPHQHDFRTVGQAVPTAVHHQSAPLRAGVSGRENLIQANRSTGKVESEAGMGTVFSVTLLAADESGISI